MKKNRYFIDSFTEAPEVAEYERSMWSVFFVIFRKGITP